MAFASGSLVTAAAGMDRAGVSRMTQLLADPAHWRLRAHEARQRAKQLGDPEAKALQGKMADKYEDLAALDVARRRAGPRGVP